MKEQFKNNSATTLSAAITSTSATAITVANATQLPSSPQFRIIVDSELMLVTGISGNTLTVVRGAEGSAATVHSNGSAVTHIVTVGSLQAYGRDNDGYFDGARPPLQLLDASGNTLTSSSFTTYNGAGDAHAAVVSDSDRRITIKRQAGSGSGSAELMTHLARSAPATPYSIIIAIQPLVTTDSGKFASIVGFRESSTGKAKVLRIAYFSGVNEFAINTYTNEASAGFVTTIDFPLLAPVQWYKLTDDGTNVTYYFGDGVNWMQLHQVARTTYFTARPDQVIWGCGANSNPYDSFCSLLAWSE